MLRFLLGLLVFTSLSFGKPQTSITPADIQKTLSQAEALYYDAQFRDSIQLLTPLDIALRQQPNYLQESVRIKLQLALAHVGLNDMDAAKTRFEELTSLDPDYQLDPRLFAPKIVSLFNQTRSEQNETRCSTMCVQAKKLLDTTNPQPLVDLIKSAPKACSCLQTVAKDAAELFFMEGLDAYKVDDFVRAQQGFRTALAFDPKHAFAGQYIDLTQNKMQVMVDRLFVDWRRNFEVGAYPQAIGAYLQLASPNLAETAALPLEQIRQEYRRMVASIRDGWKRRCSVDLRALPSETLNHARELLPDEAIAKDILEDFGTCPPPPSDFRACLQASAQLAYSRLKTRVDPEIPRSARTGSTVTVLVKMTIDKNGNVTVNDIRAPNSLRTEPIKAAVEQWKFAAPQVAGQPRCVETEVPIELGP